MNLNLLINFKNEFFILCILIIIHTSKQSNAKEGSCPEGFVDWDPNSEFCYLIYSEQATWTDALDICKDAGGNLPSVNSPEEQEILKKNAFQQGANAWIGLRAENADSPWTWSDGSESTTTFWDEGEPNFGNPEVAYCAYINRNKDGRWDDNRCDDQLHEILCKIKKHEINAELISYWDNGECGPYGDDYNWDWCGANSGEPCKEKVETDQCPSGTANLKTVEGNQNAVTVEENYKLNDCWFTYYATYSCSESDQGHHCADEGQTCACYGNVKYGLDQTWTEEKVVDGSIQCTNEVFGDIVPGIKKECRCTPTNYDMVKSGVECNSADEHLGDLNNVWECADACQEISECKYFISGTGEKEGQCWWEKTESADCPEGWEDDLYDFYEMIRHVDEEKYWVDDGCPGTGTDYDGSFQPKSYQACVRCCSNEGNECVTPEKVQPCGEHKMSFDDATAICDEIGYRLCTKEELIGDGEKKGKCCGSGGSCDSEIVWTSTPENPEPEQKYWVDDGCPNKGDDYDGSFQPKSYEACARCCAIDGNTCVTPPEAQPCGEHKMPFDAAAAMCDEIDHRLCTKEELIDDKVCCGSGGDCDSEIVWTSTQENPDPGPPETVTIQSKNYPDYRFGIHSEESLTELYIVNDHVISFAEIRPGLTGDPETVSFQSKEDGKYMVNENTYLGLQEFEDGPGFANSATFKIYPDKFFGGFVAIEPVNQPGSFIRHQNYRLLAHLETDDELYKNDASFLIMGDVPEPTTTMEPPPPPEPKDYIVDCEKRNFQDSIDYCTSRGCTISSFHSDDDINSVKDRITCKAYIGATSDGNGKWSYIDGTEWWPYSQNDGLAGIDETKIVWNDDGTGWHDWKTGEDPQGVICQQCHEQSTTTTAPPPPPPKLPCSEKSPEDGWVTTESTPDFCYYGVTQAKNWQGANEDCRSKGGYLTSIHSNEENDFVSSILPDSTFWIGLVKSQKGGQRHWSDNSPHDYDNWIEGEPNDSGNGEDCTESWGRNIADIGGKWNDLICSGTFVYICKKYKEGHEPTAPPPTETPSGHCYDDGSTYEFNHNCYKWLTRPEGYSWADAVKACDDVDVNWAFADRMHLASIHSERESAFIKTMYTYLPNENQNTIFWFGASDETTEGEWSYVDGSKFDYTHWEGNEPNNQGEEDCATLASGENHPSFWNDAPCSGTYGALCKTTVFSSNENPPLLETCENEGLPDFFRFNGACYKWMDVPKTWDEAEQDCKNQHSSHLVSIPTDMEQSYVFANAQQSQAWIGLNNKENKDIFKWSDGWDMTYQNWYPNQQPSSDENQCAYLDVNKFFCEESCGYPEGYWFATSCSETHPYMCKYGDVSPDTLKCPGNDWIHYGPSCYRAYSTNDGDLRSFTEARGFCQSQGGDLITLGSQEEEQNVLKQIVDGYMVSNIFWIGLHKSEGAQGESYEDDYEWVDGSLKEYNHFADSYPNSRNDIEKCIMADNDWGNQADEDARLRWKNYNCETRMEFVCEVPAGRDVPTTVQPPTLAPQVPCDPDNESDGWIKFPIDQGGNEEYCYFFSTVSPMGFLDARQNCQQQGGELASIHSAEENSFLMHNLGSNDVAWIGFLKDAPTDQFLWTDGSSPDFLGWGPGEPNDAMDMESCAHLVTKTGTWNDEICYSNHNFVCKKPFNGTWPSPPPTTIPEGHCRADFSEFQGYCYKMLGFEGDDSKKDWNGAKDACNNFQVGKAYDLASIHNPREAAYVTTMLADLPTDVFTSFWIGANEGAATEGVWWWSDESRWDFDNWAQGQPDDWSSAFDCAVIKDRDVGNDVGKWDDIGCYEINGYICKTRASIEYNAPPATPKCDDVPEVADYKFTKFNGNCYKYQSNKVTWQEAESACQQMGGSHLVSINDAMEQAFAFTRIKSVSTWIGLNNKQSHELFKWSDGWRVSYTNWGMEDNTKEEACVQLNITTGKWDAMGCDLTRPYMCKFSTVQPPTPNPNGECPDKFQDLDSSSEYCYYISPDTDGKSWGDAHSECFAYEGTLASIHSEESNSRISDALRGRSKDVWIGLQADIHGTWNWVDETPFDYNNWHDGEPNHNDDFNYCAKIYEAVGDDYVGTWDDDLCNTLNGFICEKKRIPGPPPDTTPGNPTTTTSKVTNGPTTTTTSPSGLSSGAKAAVAICMLLLIAALVGGCVWFYFFMKQRNFEFNKLWNEYQVRAKLGKTNASTPSGFDNVAYVNNSEDSRIHNDILDSA